MKIHEYQAKEILRRYGVATPRGVPCFSVDEAVAAARSLGGGVWVVKAQIHAGGRGKGGGVKLARSIDELRAHAGSILGMQLKTHQTGPEGQKVRRLLIEEGADIRKEWYVGMVVDRGTQRVALMASSEGGMDIEEVAAKTPHKIHKVFIDPQAGLGDAEAEAAARAIGVPEASLPQARAVLQGLYRAFWDCDASLAEINPLILTGDGRVVALDAKMNFDDNALFRHPDIVAMRDLDEEDPAEVEASKYDLSYIQLDGDIGCLVNGAGLAMATMDVIKLYGGNPANFLDVGGGATTEKVTEAFKIMLRNPDLKAILVNIFGGIMKCDTIAEGVVAASRAVSLKVPLVVRMKGTNEDLGKKILADSGLPIITADNMAQAAERVVAAAAGRAVEPAGGGRAPRRRAAAATSRGKPRAASRRGAKHSARKPSVAKSRAAKPAAGAKKRTAAARAATVKRGTGAARKRQPAKRAATARGPRRRAARKAK
jgi:succinyl-CoA synthetase beta subunit